MFNFFPTKMKGYSSKNSDDLLVRNFRGGVNLLGQVSNFISANLEMNDKSFHFIFLKEQFELELGTFGHTKILTFCFVSKIKKF